MQDTDAEIFDFPTYGFLFKCDLCQYKNDKKLKSTKVKRKKTVSNNVIL